MTNLKREYSGLIPAIPVPFSSDMQIDEPSLRRLSKHLVKTKAVAGLLTNGHTGEVFALNAVERATVTRIVAEEVSKHSDLPVISAVACEGINDAVLHGVMAKDAGARALMIMPPHHWLRFGYRRSNVLDLFDAVAQATALDIFVHVYPGWTKASYPSELLGALSPTLRQSVQTRNPRHEPICSRYCSHPGGTIRRRLFSLVMTNTCCPPWCKASMAPWSVLVRLSLRRSTTFGMRAEGGSARGAEAPGLY